MHSLLILFLFSTAHPAARQECLPSCGAVQACAPAPASQADADAWLLLAGLVVAAAGRLAAQPRR